MNRAAWQRISRDFCKAKVEQWGARAGSVLVGIVTVILVAWLYLFVALLVDQGRIPGFAELSAGEHKRLVAEWSAWTPEQRQERGARFGVSPAAQQQVTDQALDAALPLEQWEGIWRAVAYQALEEHVGPEAAEAYRASLGESRVGPSGPLGVLPVVVQERQRWAGRFLGRLAAWNGWTWLPSASGIPNFPYLTGLFLAAIVLVTLRSLASTTVTYLASAVMLDVITRLRRAIYLHTYRLGSLAIRTAGTAEAEALFTRQTETAGQAMYSVVTLPWRAIPQLVGLLLLILLVHFWLAVTFVVMAALVWLVGGQLSAYYRREGRQGSRQLQNAQALLLESLRLVRLVKCYQLERFNQNRVERQLGTLSRAAWRKLRGDALAEPMLHAVALLGGVGLLYLGGLSVLAGEFSGAGLAVLAVALVGLAPAVVDLFRVRSRWRRGVEAADAILEYLERKGEAAEAVDAEYLPPLRSRIEFRNVSLLEPGSDRYLLENLTFAIPAGAKVAFVGPERRALRSLAYLLPRFFDPTQGEIRIEDKNIRWVTHESLRLQVALVMEDEWVFTDTVANNIGCGDPQYRLPQIIEAAKLAHAHQFIERLPYGYETVIGEHGVPLTPGQAFRIALARALVRDPSILVVEEPGPPVDEDTLVLLDDTLQRVAPGRTILLLAQRLTTLRWVDRVFLIVNGKISDMGTHRELWQRNDYYRRLQLLAEAQVAETASSPQE
jgi:ATP-binding cassette subfamily B protein